ncbi:RNA 2',3'-cyclic phosphodiesterase [Geosporobacter ferrireducens]|uniref:RNA 2',3'-cyclic phosphodiesterase n=1 Tax=Geosporobacter ferrireducens TaxID=1424294 RepID=A0A1D8GIQ5_9FIRM|nr:RNA 2',3'-cyclic phosphodiesterase [Geosporobacter ferrireducens]AOT70804.1 2'-5' RNA ligase [Geosporobacter ferrireducens]
MRVFIAIELEEGIRNYLIDQQRIIRKNSKKGNFTRRENLHLTLRFIGEIDRNDIQRIESAMEEAVEKKDLFYMKLGAMGEFPRGNKRILWIGISEGLQSLKDLFERLEAALEKRGFSREAKGLTPHITLGREVVLEKDTVDLARELDTVPKAIKVAKISLMESTRINSVLQYVPIFVKELK